MCVFSEYVNCMVLFLQYAFQFLLLTIVSTCLHDIAFSPKFVSLGYILSFKIMFDVLLDVSRDRAQKGS